MNQYSSLHLVCIWLQIKSILGGKRKRRRRKKKNRYALWCYDVQRTKKHHAKSSPLSRPISSIIFKPKSSRNSYFGDHLGSFKRLSFAWTDGAFFVRSGSVHVKATGENAPHRRQGFVNKGGFNDPSELLLPPATQVILTPRSCSTTEAASEGSAVSRTSWPHPFSFAGLGGGWPQSCSHCNPAQARGPVGSSC